MLSCSQYLTSLTIYLLSWYTEIGENDGMRLCEVSTCPCLILFALTTKLLLNHKLTAHCSPFSPCFKTLSVNGRPAQQDNQHGRRAEGGGEQPVQLPAQHVLGRGHRRGRHDQQTARNRVGIMLTWFGEKALARFVEF